MVFDLAWLAFADHVHGLNAGDKGSDAAKAFDAEHRPCDSFDDAVVLLDEVVELLGLAHHDGQATVGLDAPDGGRVGAALALEG